MSVQLFLATVTANPNYLYKYTNSFAEMSDSPVPLIVFCNGVEPDLEQISKKFESVTLLKAEKNLGVTVPLHRIYEHLKAAGAKDSDVICYIHDDVIVHERGWEKRVRDAFADPKIGLGGFSGALGLGSPDIYRKPYDFFHMLRYDFTSNLVNAEAHGKRTTKDIPIVTVDGYSMFVRMELLNKIGGWSWYPSPHHGYDDAIACQNRKHGYRGRLVACRSEHLSGGTSGGAAYIELAKDFGGDQKIHNDANRWLYDTFRGVLPFRVSSSER